jgi:hypothetical protein
VAVVNDTCTAGICGLPRLATADIKVSGQGVCSFRLDLGNGSFLDQANYDFSAGPRMFHGFPFASGWPGPKTITAFGQNGCLGRATVSHHVFTNVGSSGETWTVGMNTPNQECFAVPGPGGGTFPPLRPATRVHITAPTTPEVKFGTFVHYGPDGQPGSSAPQGFSFPGYRAYSLIVRIGNEIHQAGTNATFTTVHGGDVSLCDNDDNPSDNLGGWQVNIFVDESQAP